MPGFCCRSAQVARAGRAVLVGWGRRHVGLHPVQDAEGVQVQCAGDADGLPAQLLGRHTADIRRGLVQRPHAALRADDTGSQRGGQDLVDDQVGQRPPLLERRGRQVRHPALVTLAASSNSCAAMAAQPDELPLRTRSHGTTQAALIRAVPLPDFFT